ncbi:helix-turn-helix domain-containing protein [Neobacillus drentensis]|uniref:helix-turn-helix domain-containing protein n=1 Tax=Neobacillus drentensis TaxID=220684 RepID=UPI002FFDF67F
MTKQKTKDDYPMILTVNEVMEILRIGKRIAYDLMSHTDFPTIKIGKLKRVQRDAFFDWLNKEGLDSKQNY